MRLLKEIRHLIGNYHVKSGVYHYYRNEFKQAIGFLRKALSDPGALSPGDLKNARCYRALSHKGLGLKLARQGKLKEGVGLPHAPLYYGLVDFVTSVTESKPAVCSAEEGLRAAVVGMLSQRAVITGEEQEIDRKLFELG